MNEKNLESTLEQTGQKKKLVDTTKLIKWCGTVFIIQF